MQWEGPSSHCATSDESSDLFTVITHSCSFWELAIIWTQFIIWTATRDIGCPISRYFNFVEIQDSINLLVKIYELTFYISIFICFLWCTLQSRIVSAYQTRYLYSSTLSRADASAPSWNHCYSQWSYQRWISLVDHTINHIIWSCTRTSSHKLLIAEWYTYNLTSSPFLH